MFLFCVSFLFRIEKYFLKLFLSRQLEVAGLKEAGPVVEKEAVLRLTTFLIDKVGYLLLLVDKVNTLFIFKVDQFSLIGKLTNFLNFKTTDSRCKITS